MTHENNSAALGNATTFRKYLKSLLTVQPIVFLNLLLNFQR